jgi:O-antigen ligase
VAIVVWGGAAISGRVTVDSPDRHHEWTAALAVARRHPVVGVGPTKAVFSWTAPDGTLMAVAYAHNELLQVLSTEGAVGLGVVVIGLLSIGRWVQRRLSVVPRWVGASTVSAAVTAAVGAATDFVWHIPLIPVLGAVLVALTAPCALTPDRSSGPAERQAACDTDDD